MKFIKPKVLVIRAKKVENRMVHKIDQVGFNNFEILGILDCIKAEILIKMRQKEL